MGMLYSSSIRSLQGINIHKYEYLYHFWAKPHKLLVGCSGFTFNREKHEMYEKKTAANGAKDAQ
jgi:hypothetical protein